MDFQTFFSRHYKKAVSQQAAIADFAAKVGAAPGTIRKWLSDERAPNEDFILEVELATGGKVTPLDWWSHGAINTRKNKRKRRSA